MAYLKDIEADLYSIGLMDESGEQMGPLLEKSFTALAGAAKWIVIDAEGVEVAACDEAYHAALIARVLNAYVAPPPPPSKDNVDM